MPSSSSSSQARETWERPLAKLEKISFGAVNVGDIVGRGRFKRVHQGRYRGRDVVLLRYSKDITRGFSPRQRQPAGDHGEERRPEDDVDRNFNELRILGLLAKKCSYPHIPEIYGVCRESHSYIIVQEFAAWGTLKSVLQSPGLAAVASNLHRLHISQQVARAMAYLEGERVVHADLSCRNVLIFRFEEAPHLMQAKVSDFGLSIILPEGVVYECKKQPMATRWCSPETIAECKLSHRADAWSLGVTIWEIYATGGTPWPLREKRATVAARLRDIAETGGSAEGTNSVEADFPRSVGCPHVVHHTILSCLNADEFARPSFQDLTDTLGRIIKEGGEKDSRLLQRATTPLSPAGQDGRASASDLLRRRSFEEPNSPEWRSWSALHNGDVAERLQVLRIFPESERRVLLEAENRLLRQRDSLSSMRRSMSSQQLSGTPGMGSPRVTVTPRILTSRTPPSSVHSATGFWTIWTMTGPGLQQQNFQAEAEARTAFEAHKKAGCPCTLRDPNGVEVSSSSWCSTECCSPEPWCNAVRLPQQQTSSVRPHPDELLCITPPVRGAADTGCPPVLLSGYGSSVSTVVGGSSSARIRSSTGMLPSGTGSPPVAPPSGSTSIAAAAAAAAAAVAALQRSAASANATAGANHGGGSITMGMAPRCLSR